MLVPLLPIMQLAFRSWHRAGRGAARAALVLTWLLHAAVAQKCLLEHLRVSTPETSQGQSMIQAAPATLTAPLQLCHTMQPLFAATGLWSQARVLHSCWLLQFARLQHHIGRSSPGLRPGMHVRPPQGTLRRSGPLPPPLPGAGRTPGWCAPQSCTACRQTRRVAPG